ncbi:MULTISPECIES: helix-turn-helix domain-containing protein [Elizabethkingia]|uniref:helix-turn-helix domain-containing protein n=1 Tax=Elizabethkingia TaxID=308865 RepID=UPI00099AF7D3|nr:MULTISPECIES: response regulator transcription factor [Elizabethkingia]AQX90604.1 AraC family transcriptional regulator [Elizabethkingia anophelis]EHM7981755.1 helix-turn-helix transcriptional regulator [Elizabethkingia anophelis]EHM8032253.1 helix-turn-helix transcriptional regulator [Elizabethkingia anophelis]EHZ9535207.1 helix-turn-helix transcriptional regulator [Elizabethkingia anophelis]EKU3673117.1 helix-turn-helix transcriptional regulator [Elizabethkingia anophelis]
MNIVKTISEYHRLRSFSEPDHPLISVVDLSAIPAKQNISGVVINFYSVCIKRSSNINLKYGQQEYDFDSGVMFFMAPNQVFSLHTCSEEVPQQEGYLLLMHPDFFWNTSLAKKIKHYDFFNYSVKEALFLSKKEEVKIMNIIKDIEQEYQANMDNFSKPITISYIETLLSFSERFYNRQFITREKENHQILNRLEKLLTDYFNNEDLISKGLPSVQFVAESLNMSSGYLGNMLRTLTGQNTQQHIHDKLIEKAKEKLSTTNLSVSEIAYELGFEHPQSFSKLFKNKTKQSPSEFRSSFN